MSSKSGKIGFPCASKQGSILHFAKRRTHISNCSTSAFWYKIESLATKWESLEFFSNSYQMYARANSSTPAKHKMITIFNFAVGTCKHRVRIFQESFGNKFVWVLIEFWVMVHGKCVSNDSCSFGNKVLAESNCKVLDEYKPNIEQIPRSYHPPLQNVMQGVWLAGIAYILSGQLSSMALLPCQWIQVVDCAPWWKYQLQCITFLVHLGDEEVRQTSKKEFLIWYLNHRQGDQLIIVCIQAFS